MKLDRLIEVLSKNNNNKLNNRAIKKISIEKGETMYAIQIVTEAIYQSIGTHDEPICIFEKIDNTEVLDFEEG